MARGLILLALVACTKATPVPRDDEPKIRAILDADKALDRALKEADDASAKGDDAKAADILESKAASAADAAIQTADSQNCATQWCSDQKAALLSVLHDRKDAIPVYAKALRGDDLEAKLAAVQKQIDIEKRAMEVSEKARQTP